MGNKRKIEDKEDKIRRKIRILENKLKKPTRRRIRVCSSSSEDEFSRSSVSHATKRDDRDDLLCPDSPLLPETALEPTQEAPPEPSTSTMEGTEELDEEILKLLGEAPKVKTTLGKNIHKEIGARWQELLSRGLKKEVKDNICQEYLVPANCDLLVAPNLNPEAKAALTNFYIKRDHALKENQQQIGTALAALSQATELVIAKENPAKVLKPLSDACRLLCDLHYSETKARRTFVISAVKTELRDMLINTARDQFLFGENLGEQIRAANNIQKSGEGLKVTQKHPMFDKSKFIKNNNNNQQKNRLNSKTPYRGVGPGRYNAGQGRAPPQQMTRSLRGRQQQSQPRARERSPPYRSCRK